VGEPRERLHRSRALMRYRLSLTLSALAVLPTLAAAQPVRTSQSANAGVVRGIYNWIHTTGDAERGFAFYRDIFGIELARSPFAGPASPDAAAPPIRPVSEAGSDELVWNLTNTRGARFRTVFMRAANTPFGLELSEFFDIPREDRPANPWDPGASTLIFAVRDLSLIAARLAGAGARIVTLGGMPLDTPRGRTILVRDTDGYLVEVIQASRADIASAASPGEVIGTSIGISVADTDTALAFYRDLLGFEVLDTRRATATELRVHGLTDGELTQTTAVIPGTRVAVSISEFDVTGTQNAPPHRYRWRIQDVGAPQFQLQVADLDTLLDRTQRAGYGFLSVDARPIQRPFGRFVFAIDPDGVLVEFVEPAR
jgi:predicted enzyme related to lactoylglutathione lyase